MPLQSSGQISLNDIHIEAGGSSGTYCAINNSDIRALIGKASGAQSSFSEFYGASNAPEYNLVTSSAPSGLTYLPNQSTLLTDFNSTYGYRTAGNAGGSVYELYTTDTFTGDVLFEVSVLVTNRCSDPAIAIWDSSTTPQWQWGANTSRISFQFNCDNPYLYGNNTSTTVGSSITYGAGIYYTLHIHHKPSASQTRAWTTRALNDWGNETTNRIGNIITTSNNYGSSPIRAGIASDYDGASLSSTSTNFQRFKVTPGY